MRTGLAPLPAGCPEACRGCAHRRFSREESLEEKRDFVERSLATRVAPIEVGGQRFGYRDKVCFHARWEGFRWELGFLGDREPGSWKRRLVPVPECPVHSERVRESAKILSRALPPELPLSFVVFSGSLLTLVLKCAKRSVVLPDLLSVELSRLGIEGLFLNFHPSAGNRVFSSDWSLAWGEARSRSELGLLHGPASFQQLIPELYESALAKAEEFLALKDGDMVVDLCSGLGASLLRWQACGVHAIGVELSGEAVECARKTLAAAPLPSGPRAEILRGRCSDRIPQLDRWLAQAGARTSGVRARALAFANPPRTGLEPEVTRWLTAEACPKRIAYLSCSPTTLARDIAMLENYEVHALTPFDFFPGTHHVETLALLERR